MPANILSVHLSILHPRLLSTLILYEPVMMSSRNGEPNPALMPTMRRDLWESRAKAETSFRKAFKTFDPRVLERYLKYGLREVPTVLYNPTVDTTIPASAVTLATSKHQEAWAYTQTNLEPREAGLDRLLLPDWDQTLDIPFLYTSAECRITMENLPHLRPSVLYIFGAKSPLSPLSSQDEKMKLTGSGLGGSGGVVEGKVEKVTLMDLGHLLVFEDVKESARVSAAWIDQWFQQWLAQAQNFWEGVRGMVIQLVWSYDYRNKHVLF